MILNICLNRKNVIPKKFDKWSIVLLIQEVINILINTNGG